jgi:hypothetical protein
MTKVEMLKPAIINAFSNAFEYRCVSLLCDAFASMQEACCIDITSEEEEEEEEKEEHISTLLFDYVDKSPQAADWHIGVAPEYRDYKNNILKNKRVTAEIPKISLQFGSWTNELCLDYFVETQNVTEYPFDDSKKSKWHNPIVITESHLQYISKIDKHLLNNRPVQGCIIAYITDGDIRHTTNCLNHYLCDCNRVAEILKKPPVCLQQFDACYVSVHNNCSIQHLMFDFSNENKVEENE